MSAGRSSAHRQRRIEPADLPTGEQRIRMLGDAIAGFIANGYVYISGPEWRAAPAPHQAAIAPAG